MSYNNVPDDWNQYWTTCPKCREKYHLSEGGCECINKEIKEDMEDEIDSEILDNYRYSFWS